MNRGMLAGLIWLAAAASADGGETAAFLKIGASARAIAMGNAYTAAGDDSDSLFWNPAGLATLNRTELIATHSSMYMGASYDAVSVGVPLGSAAGVRKQDYYGSSGRWIDSSLTAPLVSRGVLAVGFTQLRQPSQEGRDENRRLSGSFDAMDYAVAVGYAREAAPGLRAGVTVKRVESRLANASAGTTAADVGALYRIGSSGWRLGAAVRNLGPGLRYDRESSDLPLTGSLGLSLTIKSSLLLAADVSVLPRSQDKSLSIGTEYLLINSLALRAGYSMNQQARGGRSGSPMPGDLGGGLGLRLGRFRLDYSISPYGELGNVQRISIGSRF